MPQTPHTCTNQWYPGGPSLLEVYESCKPCKRWLDKKGPLYRFAVATQEYDNW